MNSQNPLKTLLQSRKFWVMILDLVVSFLLYFVAKYAQVALEDVKFVILVLQPVFLLLIYTIYGQNVETIKSPFLYSEKKLSLDQKVKLGK